MVRRIFFVALIVVPAGIFGLSLVFKPAIWLFAVVGPFLLLGLHDVIQTRHALLRVFPVIGHGRYLMEALRPEIQQYFVEDNIDGRPYNREMRSLIYQRAKGVRDTIPFGTQRDVHVIGYEWMNHSLRPTPMRQDQPRIRVGNGQCDKPYNSSYLNISAMSFGSLSKNSILALNWGAKLGEFAHNTGEGGISPYHLEHGGDLTWQVGTGYFGCRTLDGKFCPDRFKENASRPEVKMIELKLSQGAKPGHGGILPASKVTPEIAEIRGVPLGEDVLSPPTHNAFDSPAGLIQFLGRLRELSGGKPVGFKLCVGYRTEFLAICKAMLETGIYPDFVTVDGTEGGTGAAPVELTNSVGRPSREGLLLVHNALVGTNVRDKVRIIGAAKVATGFDMLRLKALGADLCNSGRSMMFALGCIQARHCNSNKCPVGVATQDPSRVAGLVVKRKAPRVHRFHEETIHSFNELVSATGLGSPDDVTPGHIMRRMGPTDVRTFAEIYDFLEPGDLLASAPPPKWAKHWNRASAQTF